MYLLKKAFVLILLLLSFTHCDTPKGNKTKNNQFISPDYAKGFAYQKFDKYTHIIVKQPYKGATHPYEYILIKGDTTIVPKNEYQIVLKTPIKKIIATSNTQIPILESLHTEHLIKGYPNTSFISSSKTRTLIDDGKIIDIGHEEHVDTELVLNINPDVFFAFAVDQLNKNIRSLQTAGIPIVIDGSWLEESPLGRAEWIKFFALFLDKEKEAEDFFNTVKQNYTNALQLTKKSSYSPTILYGSIYADVWYTPAGKSYIAQILHDAKTNYFWKNTQGAGSLSLQFENVFVKAKNADYWLAPGAATTKKALDKENKHYHQFKPFQQNNIYSYSNTTGDTGGLLFFELGASRPDLILKDIIKICHPELLPTYETTFFKRLSNTN